MLMINRAYDISFATISPLLVDHYTVSRPLEEEINCLSLSSLHFGTEGRMKYCSGNTTYLTKNTIFA